MWIYATMVDQWHVAGPHPNRHVAKIPSQLVLQISGGTVHSSAFSYVFWIEPTASTRQERSSCRNAKFRRNLFRSQGAAPAGVLRPESGKVSRTILYGSMLISSTCMKLRGMQLDLFAQ